MVSEVCRVYVGQGDSGSCRRSEKILQDLHAYVPLVYASPASLKTHLCSSTMKQKPWTASVPVIIVPLVPVHERPAPLAESTVLRAA